MIEELHTSGSLLRTALERHSRACSTIANRFESGNAFTTISEVVTSELELIASYEAIMKRAQTDIRRVRNSCPTIVPINVLPPEILARIFQLVVRSQHYNRRGYSRPEILSHVCSRWKHIAVGFHGLWNHIDLAPFHSPNKLLARGKMFAARAGPLMLNVDIAGGRHQSRSVTPDNNLSTFCASIASRISSLELVVRDGVQGAYPSILKACFANCVPGTLGYLDLKGHFARPLTKDYRFIEAENPTDDSSQVLHMPNRQFEAVLLHVKALHLRGAYFRWNSLAYHGLVELTLLPQRFSRSPSVDESQLAGVLVASPMLREFTFGLEITNIAHGGPPPPVVLDELECMVLYSINDSQHKTLLRMISPGSKPLWLGLEFQTVLPPDHDDEFDKFLARANLTELRIRVQYPHDGGSFLYLPKLLRLSPSLRNLTVYGYDFSNCLCASGVGEDEDVPVGLRLNNLDLFHCTVDLAQLERMAKIVSIQTLRLAKNCQLVRRSRSQMQDKRELSEIFPNSVVESIASEEFGNSLGLDS